MARFAIFIFLLLAPLHLRAQDVQLRFIFFDEAGHQLDARAVVNRMTNGQPERFSTGTFDLGTMRAVTLHNSLGNGTQWVTSLERLVEFPRQGFMVHWDTQSTGYSSFLLDNEGQGFTRSEAVIFNERLALDAHHQLLEAMSVRPGFEPSPGLKAELGEMEFCFEALTAVRDAGAPLRGKTGQRCLDLTAVAMRTFMLEAGTDAARKSPNPRWGITIEPDSDKSLDEEFARVDALQGLFDARNTWVRLAMFGDGTDDLKRLKAIAARVREKGYRTMGQLFDSHRAAKVPYAKFVQRVEQVLSDQELRRITAWEIGNEVNGGWLGADVVKKIRYAAEAVRRHMPERGPENSLCVTFYWTSTEDTLRSSLFNWIHENVLATGLDKDFDCVGLSVYTAEEPLGFGWEHATRKLADTFPGKSMMIGETDFVYKPFREGPASESTEVAGANYVRSRYAGAFAIPRSFGGVFWWSSDDLLREGSLMRRALRELYCSVYPALCGIQDEPAHDTPKPAEGNLLTWKNLFDPLY